MLLALNWERGNDSKSKRGRVREVGTERRGWRGGKERESKTEA